MRAEPSLTVISLGGGVQSSVMALMASQGAFDRVPDCAIFADTRWEPPSVYEHIDWLEGQLSFPLHVVDNGRSLREDVKALTNHSGSRSYVDIPVYLKGRERRRATASAAASAPTTTRSGPSARKIRDLLELRRRQRVPAGTIRRAVAGHLHRRGHPHEDLPRQMDDEPIPAHRGGHVPERLPGTDGLVGSPLRQAPGTLGLRRLPLPVPSQMGGDQAPVAGAVRRGGWRSTPGCGTGWPWTRPHTSTCCGFRLPRRSPSTKRSWEPMGRGTGSATSARDTVGCEWMACLTALMY